LPNGTARVLATPRLLLPRYVVEAAGAFRCFMTLNSAFIAA